MRSLLNIFHSSNSYLITCTDELEMKLQWENVKMQFADSEEVNLSEKLTQCVNMRNKKVHQ